MTNTKSVTHLVDAALAIEKQRVAAEVRQTHLFRNGVIDLVREGAVAAQLSKDILKLWDKKRELPNLPSNLVDRLHDLETDELHRRLKDLEDFVDGRVAHLIQSHPAYPWFSRIKGVGKENIGKVVAPVDIERATTISALWKFAGFSVEDGTAPKRVKGGGKLAYNSQLRSMGWRLGSALLKAGLRKQCTNCMLVVGEEKIRKNNGKCPDCGSGDFKTVAITKFGTYYLNEKEKYIQRYQNQGVKIVPATSLPKKDGKRYEPDDMISEGHVHNQAMRKMIKLFLACLWLTWREAEGLPVTKPYAIGQLGHNSFINPWDMVDR